MGSRAAHSVAAKLTAEAMVRSLAIAERLGCLDADGLRDIREGQAATVRRRLDTGDPVSVDHTIPRAVASERDNNPAASLIGWYWG